MIYNFIDSNYKFWALKLSNVKFDYLDSALELGRVKI